MQDLELIEPFLAGLIQSRDAGPSNRAYVVIEKDPEKVIYFLCVQGVKLPIIATETLYELLRLLATGPVKVVLMAQRQALLQADKDIPPGTWVAVPTGQQIQIRNSKAPGTKYTLGDILKM